MFVDTMLSGGFILCGLGLGALFVGIGLPLGLSMPYLFSSILQLQLQLGPGSTTFAEWNDNPVPIYMEFYFWNWTNAVEFAENYTLIPSFEEIGPFTFSVKTKRVNVSWNNDNTVTFSPARTFYFEPSMSLDLSTPITTLSPVPAVLAYYSRYWPSAFFKLIINREVELREKIYKTDSAGNWMFFGIDDSLLDLIVPLRDVADLPLPFDKFAWFFGRNGSAAAEGNFTMHTGTDNLANLGKLTKWKDSNETGAYSGECDHVKGTTGEVLPPMINSEPKNLSVFSADICSHITLEYIGKTSEEGVPGWEFVGSPLALDDGTLNSENSCFCNGECVPAGARNISVCKFGAPAFVTFPHFYLADKTYSSRVLGMRPNESLHRFTLKVEPTTGVPLAVAAQLQVNLLIRHSETLDLYRNLPEIYFPMLWFRERANITPELAKLLNAVLIAPTVGYALFYSMAGVGIIILGTFFYLSNRGQEINTKL